MNFDALGGLGLGLLLGARHALEPDHLAALSTLSTDRPSLGKGAFLGAFWGGGHTTSLLVVGFVLAALRADMPPRVATSFEFGVALMLIALGLRALARARAKGSRGPILAHVHGATSHIHNGPAAHLHFWRWTIARRPFLVGVVHGLAGSGAVTTLAAASLPSGGERIAFIVLFGLGSILGMAALSGLAELPLAYLARRPAVSAFLTASTGVISLVVGVAWCYPVFGEVFSAGFAFLSCIGGRT